MKKQEVPDPIINVIEQIESIARQYRENEEILISKTQSQENEINGLKEIVVMRNARAKKFEDVIAGKITDWHRIRDWLLWFVAAGQFGFILTQLL